MSEHGKTKGGDASEGRGCFWFLWAIAIVALAVVGFLANLLSNTHLGM